MGRKKKDTEVDLNCIFCNKRFSHLSGKYRHQKHRCPLRIDQKKETIIIKNHIDENNNIDEKDNEVGKNGEKEKEKKTDEDKDENEDEENNNFVSNLERDEYVNIINELKKEQEHTNKQISKLTQLVEDKMVEDKTIVNNINNNNINNINSNNNITIYITDKVDFLQLFTERFGDENKAINYFKEKISKDIEGDLDVFCDVYLQGPSKNWSLICQDPSTDTFLIKDSDNNIIKDPGGAKLYKNFKNNYADTLLKLSSKEINNVVNDNLDIKNTNDFEKQRDYLLDDFDLSMMQNKVFSLFRASHLSFAKKLKIRIKTLTTNNYDNSIIDFINM